jgi:dolichyl-phosphate-mannose-protein mannosyltransferase
MAPWERWTAGALMLVCAALLAGGVQWVRLTVDEQAHYGYAWQIIHFNADRGTDNSKMPFSVLNVLPKRLAPLLPPGALRTRLNNFLFGRYATAACTLLLAWALFWWSRALYGAAGGLLTLALVAFDPNILAHGVLITTDLYATLMTALAVWSFWRLLNHEGPGAWWVVIGGAALFGLAQLAKYTCAYLVPILALTALGHAAPELWALARARRWGGISTKLLAAGKVTAVYAAAFLVVVNIGFLGWVTLKPLRDYDFVSRQFQALQVGLGPLAAVRVPVPEPYLLGLDRVLGDEREGSNVYLLGRLGADGVPGRRFPEYLAVTWLYKEPIATQVLLLLALVAYVLRFKRFDFRRNEWPLFCPILFFVLYFTFVYNFQIGLRHFLVIHPMLFVFAGSLVRYPREVHRGAWVTLAALLVWLVASVGSYYPNLVAYFNEFLWNRMNAYRIVVDSNLDWGQTDRYLARYLRRHPNAHFEPDGPMAGTLVVSSNRFSGYLLGEKFRWLRENFQPIGHVASTHLVFQVSPEALLRVTDPVSPDSGDKND